MHLNSGQNILLGLMNTVTSAFCDMCRYYQFNEKTRTMASGYPKPISMWSGAPDNIKAAIMSEDGCKFLTLLIMQMPVVPRFLFFLDFIITLSPHFPSAYTYFYKANKYWKFNNQYMKVESGYPKSVLTDWMGCKSEEPKQGRDEELIFIDDTQSSAGPLAVVIPLLLLVLVLATLGALLFFRKYGTPRRLLYCQRSLLDKV